MERRITPKSSNNVEVLPQMVPATQSTPLAMPFTLEQVGNYGTEIQTQLAEVTTKITGTTKTSDMDEVGKLLTDTIMAAKGYDPKSLFKGGLFGLFKAKSSQLRMKFDSVDQTVDRLIAQVDDRIVRFKDRVNDLSALADANNKYYDSLTEQIMFLSERADWMEANKPVVVPDNPMSAQYVQDWITVISFARKRADDLRRAQILAQQQSAQIQQMKTNSIALAQKFGDVKVTTIPAMKQTFNLYILNVEQQKGAEFAKSVDTLNNDVIQRNAAMLGANTTAIHTALTQSNISMETLTVNHNSIIHALDEVKRINAEMKNRLATEGPKLEQLSQDLSTRLSTT